MQQITIKVNNATQTIGETKVVTKSGQPAIIKASKNVNYELIKDATGVAPDHIITKRIGKDLHVSIEKEGQESDLIIEDFYKYDNSALIGQAEDGRYYYYIPDTGEVADYVTQLKAGDVEGQALGGRDYPAPWWIDMGAGAISAGGFGVPWLVGLAGVVGAGVAIAKNRSDKDDAPTPPTAPTPVVNISIESVADDDIVQHTEQGTQVPVVGKVTGDFSEGNPVVVKINGQDYNTTVDAQGNFSVLVPANELVADPDHIIEATINATSPKGNASATDEHNFTVEAASQPVPVVNINIDSIATDDIVQNSEKGTNVPVVGKVTGDFTAGDEVTVHINGKIYKTPVNDQGNFSVLVPANELVADPDHIIEATINATSPKGNASASGSRGFSVETVVNQAPTVKVAVTIVPKQGEADEGQQVATSQGNDPEGEKLTYGLIPNSDPEGFYAINPNTGVVSLTKKGADHVNAGNDLPPVQVIVSDPHGATGSDKNNVPTTIDVNAPQTAPTVSIVLDANPDD
ncbi:MAG: Ig-like domain-containing protein, partial [Moraxella sp.]|nr:Ig-like domain-containing protein [Moraxella sp.]